MSKNKLIVSAVDYMDEVSDKYFIITTSNNISQEEAINKLKQIDKYLHQSFVDSVLETLYDTNADISHKKNEFDENFETIVQIIKDEPVNTVLEAFEAIVTCFFGWKIEELNCSFRFWY